MSSAHSSAYKEVKRFKKQKFHLKRFLKETLKAFNSIQNDDINKALLESSGMSVRITSTVESECRFLAEKDIGIVVLGQSNYSKAVVINEMLKKALIPVDHRRTSHQWRMIKIKSGQKNLTTLVSLDESYDLGDCNSMSSGELISDVLLFQNDEDPDESPKKNAFVCVSLQSDPLLLEGVNIICSPTYKKEYTITEVSEVYSLVTADYIPIVIYACDTLKLSEWDLLELCELRRVAEDQFFCFVIVPPVDRYMDIFFPRLLISTWSANNVTSNSSASNKINSPHYRTINSGQVSNWPMVVQANKQKSRPVTVKSSGTLVTSNVPQSSVSKQKRRPLPIDLNNLTRQQILQYPAQPNNSPVDLPLRIDSENNKSEKKTEEDLALQAQLFRVGFFIKTTTFDENNQLLNQQMRFHGWKGIDVIDDSNDQKKSNLQMSSILVSDFDQEFQKQLAQFIRRRLQNYMLHALSALYSSIVNCLQDFILQAYDISHDLLTTPKRLAFAKAQEAKLYNSLLQQANSRQNEINDMVSSTLTSMKEILPELSARQIDLTNIKNGSIQMKFPLDSTTSVVGLSGSSLQTNSMLALGTESFTGIRTDSSGSTSAGSFRAMQTISEGSLVPPVSFSTSSNLSKFTSGSDSAAIISDNDYSLQNKTNSHKIILDLDNDNQFNSRKASIITTIPQSDSTINGLIRASSISHIPSSTSISCTIDQTTKENLMTNELICGTKNIIESSNNNVESFSKTTMAVPLTSQTTIQENNEKDNQIGNKNLILVPKNQENSTGLNKSRLFGSIQFRKLRLSLRALTSSNDSTEGCEVNSDLSENLVNQTWCQLCANPNCIHRQNNHPPTAQDCKLATLTIQNFVLKKLNSVISERVLNCMEILHMACIGTLERTVAGLENMNTNDLSRPLLFQPFISVDDSEMIKNRVNDVSINPSRMNAEESIAGAYLANILQESSRRTRLSSTPTSVETAEDSSKKSNIVETEFIPRNVFDRRSNNCSVKTIAIGIQRKSSLESSISDFPDTINSQKPLVSNAMDALKSLLNFTYGLSIPCKRRTSSVMKGLFDNLKERLVRSFPWQTHMPQSFDETWKRRVAHEILDSLSENRIAKEVSEQIVERLKMSHENFVFTIRRLETRAETRSSKFEEAQENIRRQHAPRLARQALEVSSLRYFIAFGIPTLGKEIGRGQYGVVYACSSWGPFVNLAVKSVIPPDDKHWKDLALEIYYSKHIPEHERIVSMYASVIDYSYGMGTTPAVLLIMERLTRDLYTAIRKGLDWIKRLRVALDVAEGIRYLHSQGLIHRDIKPRNVLLDSQDRGKLTDLGFCKPQSMMSGSILGTPMHMAPEIFGKKYDFSVDIYAFGVLFWYICANRMHIPNHFEQCENKEALWHAVRKGIRPERLSNFSDDCWDLMKRCWASDPLTRPHPGEIHLLLEKIYLDEFRKSRNSNSMQLKSLL